MHAGAEGDGDGAKNEKAREDEKTPAAAPADVVGDAGNFADEDESGERDVEAEKDGEDVGEELVRVRPEPMRRGKLYGDPDAGEGKVILPGAGPLAYGGSGQLARGEADGGNGAGAGTRM